MTNYSSNKISQLHTAYYITIYFWTPIIEHLIYFHFSLINKMPKNIFVDRFVGSFLIISSTY